MRDGLVIVHHPPAQVAGVPAHRYPYARCSVGVTPPEAHCYGGVMLYEVPGGWPVRELDYHHALSLACWCRPRIDAGTL